MYISNDISRCTGSFPSGKTVCPIRDTCLRYKQYEFEFIHNLGFNITVPVMEPPVAEGGDCQMELPITDSLTGWVEL